MSIQEKFELYEMCLDDIISRNPQFILDQIFENLVDVRDIAIGDKNVFYVKEQMKG